MGKSREKAVAPPSASARDRPRRTLKQLELLPELNAKKAVPTMKHKTIIEFVEVTDKKKKLEFQVTFDKEPPPGFEFVPIGNPELTTLCKELSRERDAMIFVVSTTNEHANELAIHMARVGHHIRATIVDEARLQLGQPPKRGNGPSIGAPEPLPKSQLEINAQADAALRDLFPRIPNTDRQMIVDHAFKKGGTFRGEPVVGLSTDISLSRRVQLAVLAHIRHCHTRYDQLLRETSWENARRAVQSLCLDILVKWRGDEENGRDDLDEILREVVVISDSEDDEESDEAAEEEEPLPQPESRRTILSAQQESAAAVKAPHNSLDWSVDTPGRQGAGSNLPTTRRAKRMGRIARRGGRSAKSSHRGFRRYEEAWAEAVGRNREHRQPSPDPPPMGRTASYGSIPHSQGLEDSHNSANTGWVRPVDAGSREWPMLPPRDAHTDQARVGDTFAYTRGYLRPASRTKSHSTIPETAYDGKVISHRPSSQVQATSGGQLADGHFQDLLVRSIEPPSPSTAQPVYVRSLPDRKHARDEDAHYQASVKRIRRTSPSTVRMIQGDGRSGTQRVLDEHGRHESLSACYRIEDLGESSATKLYSVSRPPINRSYPDPVPLYRDYGHTLTLRYEDPRLLAPARRFEPTIQETLPLSSKARPIVIDDVQVQPRRVVVRQEYGMGQQVDAAPSTKVEPVAVYHHGNRPRHIPDHRRVVSLDEDFKGFAGYQENLPRQVHGSGPHPHHIEQEPRFEGRDRPMGRLRTPPQAFFVRRVESARPTLQGRASSMLPRQPLDRQNQDYIDLVSPDSSRPLPVGDMPELYRRRRSLPPSPSHYPAQRVRVDDQLLSRPAAESARPQIMPHRTRAGHEHVIVLQ